MKRIVDKQLYDLINTSTLSDNDSLSIEQILDVKRLVAIHKSIFSDSRYYQPGEIRINEEHARSRYIESEKKSYMVFYYKGEVTEQKIQDVLDEFKKTILNSDMSIGKKISWLYSSLDHLHPFEDGNSRTLREFTRQVADRVGYNLDWSKTNKETHSREELYKARDLEVISRTFPTLSKDSLKYAGSNEIQAYDSFSFLKENSKSLDTIIENSLSPKSKILAAKMNNDVSDDVVLKSSLSRNLEETQKTVYDAMEAERQQNFLIENQYTDSLSSIINEKNEQVKRLETKLSKLITEANSQIGRLQSSKPGIFSLPVKKKEWDNKINQQKNIVTVATQRLELVHEIRDDMGLHSSKIEDMAKKKLYYRDPHLVKKYRGVVQNENERRIAESKKKEEQKRQQEQSNKVVKSLTQSLSLSNFSR
ncbi:IncP plasmid survival protein KfrC family protein [[Pasteurella] aerogenes]